MISVIIPTYNEEYFLKRFLDSFSYNDSFEVIVADGGSEDGTVDLARGYPVRIVECSKGRAIQMNSGAEKANGGALLFLHADCTLEDGSLEAIERALNGGCVGGCLTQRIVSKKPVYRSIEASGNFRAKVLRLFYGDQAIFVRRDIFFKLGGFDQVDLFEDIMFSRKLRDSGSVAVLRKSVYAAPRRWERQGVVKATLINWLVSLGFMMGVPPSRLRRLYIDVR